MDKSIHYRAFDGEWLAVEYGSFRPGDLVKWWFDGGQCFVGFFRDFYGSGQPNGTVARYIAWNDDVADDVSVTDAVEAIAANYQNWVLCWRRWEKERLDPI